MDTGVETPRAEDATVRGILADIENRIGPQRFNAWFRRGVRLSLQDGQVNVAVPNPFVGRWIETHYQRVIAEAAQGRLHGAQSVVVTVDPGLSAAIGRRQLDQQAEMVEKAATGRARPRTPLAPSPLRHRLEDFVVGAGNRLAYSAALAVASPGGPPPFNPLFIHGSCGVGKTHLLQGICMTASRRVVGDRPLAWRYVTAEQFTNDFIGALRQKRLPDFRARYRQLDLLAIDDVHFLAAKRATQEEFLHTYNAIESAGRQVVMACDAHPRLVGDLHEGLVSRFVAGMVVRIDPPDQATRLEILRRQAARLRLHVAQDVLEYVALHIRGSVRELEGALIKLQAVAALHGGKADLGMASDALAEHLARTDSAITVGDIEAAVAAYFGITPADIRSSRRTRPVSIARMVAMFLARRHTRMSFPEIGRFMGKNHSSVIQAVQKMERLIAAKAELTWMTPAGPKCMPAPMLVELLTAEIS